MIFSLKLATDSCVVCLERLCRVYHAICVELSKGAYSMKSCWRRQRESRNTGSEIRNILTPHLSQGMKLKSSWKFPDTSPDNPLTTKLQLC
jgi:hypothetical protein